MGAPCLQFSDHSIEKFLQSSSYQRGHFKPHIERLRLYPYQADLLRLQILPCCSKEEIRKSHMVNGEPCLKQRRDLTVLHFSDMARLLPEINGIHKENPIAMFEERQQVEAKRSSIDDLDGRAKMISLFQDADSMNTYPFVFQENISQSDQ